MTSEFKSVVEGRCWTFGVEIDTGQIVPGSYVPLSDPAEIAPHMFEDVRPGLVDQVEVGDIIVAGRNFGCGSSREHAPKAIRGNGIAAVVADSFARIFYRNALNLGLLAIPVPGIRDQTDEGDIIRVDVRGGKVMNVTKGLEFEFTPYDDFVMEMIEAGGIIPYTKMKLAAA